MRSFDEIMAEAQDEPAFSNGFEGEIWMGRWCEAPCRKDRDSDCPLIMAAFLGVTPKEWTEVEPGGLENRYHCSEFEPDDKGGDGDPEPWPAPVAELDGQVDILAVFVDQVVEPVPQREAVSA
jgi:hypothetical protein